MASDIERSSVLIQDVTDARPGACLRVGGDWEDGGDDDIDTTMHAEPGLMAGS